MHVQGFTLRSGASGCTRQVYDIEELPGAIAKVMPSRRSIHWNEGYVQNEVELGVLNRLQAFEAAPRVFVYEENAAFLNAYGETDFVNPLTVAKEATKKQH